MIDRVVVKKNFFLIVEFHTFVFKSKICKVGIIGMALTIM